MKNIINKILNFFKPADFKDDIYGWLTNQMGHVSASFTICYLTNHWISFAIFWLIWEIRHFIITKNFRDFIEDLFFELSGVLIFLYQKPPLYLVIGVIILILIEKIYKQWR